MNRDERLQWAAKSAEFERRAPLEYACILLLVHLCVAAAYGIYCAARTYQGEFYVMAVVPLTIVGLLLLSAMLASKKAA